MAFSQDAEWEDEPSEAFAAAFEALESIEAELQCPVCLDTLADPHRLECGHIFSDFPTFLLCSCSIKKARIGNPFLIKAICTSILKVLHVSAAVFAEDLDKNDIVFNRLQRRLVGGVYCSHGKEGVFP